MFTFLNRPPPQECVYNLIEQTVDEKPRGPPIYRSRFSCMVKQEAACKKTGCYKTMGAPKACRCPPQNYLKKHSRAPISIKSSEPRVKVSTQTPTSIKAAGIGKEKRQQNSKEDLASCTQEAKTGGEEEATDNGCKKEATDNGCKEEATDNACEEEANNECRDLQKEEQPPCTQTSPGKSARAPRICCNIQKPPVPGRMVEKFRLEDPKNYIHYNVVKALRMPARKPAHRFVYHPKGHTHAWDESGWSRTHVYGETFGCVPSYLQDIKEELRRDDMKAKYDMKFKERDIQSQIRHLEPTEHEAITCGLKKNWEEKFAEFQALPILIDTMAKRDRKKAMEDELKALETDIQLMERHDHLFVSDTCRSFYLE